MVNHVQKMIILYTDVAYCSTVAKLQNLNIDNRCPSTPESNQTTHKPPRWCAHICT